LACTWILLVGLVLSTGFIFRGTEFKVHPRWPYALAEPQAVLHNLRLAIWPRPLCAEYAYPVSDSWREILPSLMVVLACGIATAWALARHPVWGFVGAWFFGILAPTSSVIPTREVISDRRMYLPLVAVVTVAVVCIDLAGRAAIRRGWLTGRVAAGLGGCLAVVVAGTWGVLTIERNRVYRSELAMWQDTVAQAPGNARAQGNLGNMLAAKGEFEAALAHYHKALELRPDQAGTHSNLGNTLANLGRIDEAMASYRKAIDIDPNFVDPHNNLAGLLLRLGRTTEAIEHYQKSLEIDPNHAMAHNNLGAALRQRRQLDEAVDHFRQAVRLKPDYVKAHHNLINTLAQMGRFQEALAAQQYPGLRGGNTAARR
jgi:tetratricopeptide (TPR) repeat protein